MDAIRFVLHQSTSIVKELYSCAIARRGYESMHTYYQNFTLYPGEPLYT
jgi:hypothetical protein